jgi:hypothetical protein
MIGEWGVHLQLQELVTDETLLKITINSVITPSPRTPSTHSPHTSEFYSRVKYEPIKRVEVKASLKVRLDSHQLINALLHVIRVAPIED